ncbi:MAG: TIGR00730 family Rossman fold protein [Patescibacteria group bacterium]
MNEETQKTTVNLPPKELNIEPITLHEVDEEITKRISRIEQEFKRGFDFIKTQPKTVTFFGSARFPEDNEHYQRARRIAYKLAKEGYSIVTGGGPGIMEAANRGAFEAEGPSLGLTIKLPNEQVRNPYLTDTVEFYYFFTRKVAMTFSAEAYLMFPGGFGTFDETFEILTLVQTNKIEKLPIILVGESFWNPVINAMKQVMLDENQAIDQADLSLFTITDDEDRIVEIVKAAPIRTGVRAKPLDADGRAQT